MHEEIGSGVGRGGWRTAAPQGSYLSEVTVKAMWLLAIVALVCLLFNLVAMPLWWGGVSATEGLLGAIQLIVLLGFIYIILFDLISTGAVLTRVCWLRGEAPEEGCQKGWLLVLAVLAIVGMMGAKVMVDEIARETPLGGAGGEWAILYICLGLQLAYLLAVLFQRPPSSPSASD
jgi:hypothetical protein